MATTWTCPRCRRVFRRAKQTHSCIEGVRTGWLDGKPAGLVTLYRSIEKIVKGLEDARTVVRGRSAIFSTTRVFADVAFMRGALRVAVLLEREVPDPVFGEVLRMSARRIAHVAKVRTAGEVRAVNRYIKEAHRAALGDVSTKAG